MKNKETWKPVAGYEGRYEVGTADALRLADSILEATRRHIRQRILHPDGGSTVGRA